MKSDKEIKRLESKFDIDSAREQLQKLGFRNGMKFLDVGCGGGAMTRMVAKLAKRSKIYGLDVDEGHIAYARNMAQKEHLLNISYIKGNIYSLPFNDNTFDFIWSRFLFEYIKDPLSALKELKRVVKRGGVVCVGDIDGNCLFHYPINELFKKKLDKTMELLAPFGFDPFVGRKLYYFFSKAGFRKTEMTLFPYHNIYGRPDKKDYENWKIKIESVVNFIREKKAASSEYADSLKKRFMRLIRDENTFTYSVLIFARGIK